MHWYTASAVPDTNPPEHVVVQEQINELPKFRLQEVPRLIDVQIEQSGTCIASEWNFAEFSS